MSDFVNAIQASMEAHTSEMRTMCPGTVVSYDPARNRAVVKPTLPLSLADGRALEAPHIHEVPIAWPNGAGGRFLFTWPLEAGDPVELRFAQRSLEGWLSGNNAGPDDPRRFDLSDCVADPCLKATGISTDPDAVQVKFGNTTLRLEPDGTARYTATKHVFVGPVETTSTVMAAGNVSTPADVLAGTISLKTHRHLGVQTGSGTTGLPTP